MNKGKAESAQLTELRRRAEARRRQEAMDIQDWLPEDARKLVHEIRTHQIELEMQNEELRRAQDELVESRDRYSDLYDFAPVGYVTISHKGLILEANLTLATMLGVERWALVKQPLSAFIIPDDQDVFYGHRREILESKQRVTCRIRMLRRDTDPLWAEMDSIPVEAGDESDTQSRTVISDITELKRVEEERAKLEEQLRQSQKMEAIGTLAGGIAHDFNNILHGIMGYADVAKMGLSPSDRVYQDIEHILKGAARAAELTSQLLAFSRRQMIKPTDLDLNNVIMGISEMLHRVIGEHVELDLKLGADSRTIYADSGTLGQVLLNLCVNARDAMPGGGQITITTEHVVLDDAVREAHPWASPGDYVLLSVSDTGVGMPPDVMKRVFEPFFTTKEMGKGTGLGLSMVYGIVKQHEGLIHCHSEPGKGACFKIYLPSVERIVEAKKTADDTPAPVGGTETILLAEDEEMVRDIAVLTLERSGYRVLAAKDGEEALRLFEEHRNDTEFALLDVMMPKVGGREVYETIRAHKPDLPVLFSSGYSKDAIHMGFVVEEGLETIQKPYSPSALLQKIREMLNVVN